MKEGYKKTEVGWIPKEWDIKKLGDISKIIRGASPRPKGDPLYYGGSIPRLMIADVTRDGKYVTPNIDFLTEEGAKKSRPMNKGDLVMSISGTVALPTFLNVDSCIHDGFMGFKDISYDIEKQYLYYQILNLREKLIKSATDGGVYINLTTDIVKEFSIITPPIKEQQKIAEILSTVDSQIDDTDKLIEKAKELKEGLMQRLLTKGIRHTEFKITEIGEIPVEWEVKTIGELVDLLKSGLSRSLKEENVGIPCIRSNNIKDNRLILDDLKYWYEIDDKGANIEEYILKEGDIVINFINSISQIGKGCIFNRGDFRTIYTTNLLRIQVNKTIIINKFFHYYTQTERYKKEINLITKPAVNQASFTTVEYKAIKFPVPKLEEQQEISNILSSVDAQIEEYENKKAKLEELKKALMQQLLTGKIRTV